MMDIGKQVIKLDCPDCKRSISVLLKQVANEEIVTCTCGQEIQLRDSNQSSRNAIRDINKSFKELENTLKNIGR